MTMVGLIYFWDSIQQQGEQIIDSSATSSSTAACYFLKGACNYILLCSRVLLCSLINIDRLPCESICSNSNGHPRFQTHQLPNLLRRFTIQKALDPLRKSRYRPCSPGNDSHLVRHRLAHGRAPKLRYARHESWCLNGLFGEKTVMHP